MRRPLLAAAAALLLAGSVVAVAQSPASVALRGSVAHPENLTASDLMRLPPTTVAISFDTQHGPEHATYVGALLWTLLDRAGLVDAPGRRTRLQHTVLASGRDGYAAALAIGEIDPGFEGKPVIVAYSRDGKPLTALRLVVPGDRRGGRSVKDLFALDVR
jgi:DMSO/TMAO reductase YedYZ molybdopterin-dependent catalytic subunit